MRSLWFVAGAGAGVYVMVRARRVVEVFTPEGLHDRMAGLHLGWQLFSDEVREGMAEKETELRERLIIRSDGLPALPASRATYDESSDSASGLPRPEGTEAR